MGWFGPDAGRKPMLHSLRAVEQSSRAFLPTLLELAATTRCRTAIFNFDSGNLDQPGWY